MKRSDIFFNLLLVPLDYLALVASFIVAYYLRSVKPGLIQDLVNQDLVMALNVSPIQTRSLESYLLPIMVVASLMMIVFVFCGLYKVSRFSTTAESSKKILVCISYSFLILLLFIFFRGNSIMPRLMIIYSMVISVFALFLTRSIIAFLKTILQKYGFGIIRIAILGKGQNAQRAQEFLQKYKKDGYRVVKLYGKTNLGMLTNAIAKRKFDELIIATPSIAEEDLISVREECIAHKVGFLFIPSALEVLTSKVVVRDMRGYTLIEVPATPLEGWGRIFKRILDFCGSLFGIVILSPLLILVSIFIYLDSPGPIIFRHRRLGKDLKPFWLYKFRTMRSEFCDGYGFNQQKAQRKFKDLLDSNKALKDEWSKYQKLKNDPRVTKLGAFLRKSSIDELPQLFNSLKGDLSLVGPRPIVKNELDKYGQMKHRLALINPGLTGLWQVSGRNDTTYEERVRLDMVYVENWSVWLDLVIILKTIMALIFKRGAY